MPKLKIAIYSEIPLPPDFASKALAYLDGLAEFQIDGIDLSGVKGHFRDRLRGQVNADHLLNYLEALAERRVFPQYGRYIFIIDDDGFVEGLNFVFGVARIGGKTALVFTRRLLTADLNLFYERLLKEVLHELGHTLGLGHCLNRKCVMSFSNSVFEVDVKGPGFCEKCMTIIRRVLV